MMGKLKGIFLVLTSGFILAVFFIRTAKNAEKKQIQSDLVLAGRYLFFDTRLSYNNTKSCASCHDPKFAFSDGYRRSITANGDIVSHNAPSLVNASFLYYFDWANPYITTLEKQHERPLFGQYPVELGVTGHEAEILTRLGTDSLYKQLFLEVFPKENPFTFPNIVTAIAAYVKTIRSFQSPYDRFVSGDTNALSITERRGMELFFSGRLKCSSCHVPPHFTTASITKNIDSIYYNNGLYNISGSGKYPPGDQGLVSITGKDKDRGKFRTPSLRNVSMTAPYMHDGSINSLEEVIDFYTRGGREILKGSLQGDGKNNRYKDKRVTGFVLSTEERSSLIDFLFALSDSTILTNPRFGNPREKQMETDAIN